MASYEPVIKNGASGAIFYVALKPYTANGRFQANPTLAAGDVTISIDGGAFANLATLPDAEPNSGKRIRVILSQAETNGDNLSILFSDQTDPPEWTDLHVNIRTAADNFDTIGADTAAILDDTGTNGVVLANDAITAAKFDESTAFPLTAADTGSTAVARTGADGDTLETLSDQIDDLPTNSELATALGTADDAVLAAVATVDNNVDAIKAKTDSLTFTVAGQVDANIQYVNDTEVTGDGQTGTEWGPA